MNTKAKGTRNEHRSIRLLESAGYICTRSGASLGIFDIIGISRSDIICVQVKSNSWPGSVEMEEISQFECPLNCRKLIHRWNDHQRLPQVKEVP